MSTGEEIFTDSAVGIFTALSIVNLSASLLTLWMIKGLHKNGYLLMILSLTVAQASYDASLLLFNSTSRSLQAAQLFLGTWCGIASALWALCIVLVTTYIITCQAYFDIERNFKKMFVVLTILSLANPIPALVTFVNKDTASFQVIFEAFNAVRILILILTLAGIFCCFVTLSRLRNTGRKSPVGLLARRLCMYPVVQLISRLPVTVYQLSYKQPLRDFGLLSTVPSSSQVFWFWLSIVLTPSGGIGNALAFFLVQPAARVKLMSYLRCSSDNDKGNKTLTKTLSTAAAAASSSSSSSSTSTSAAVDPTDSLYSVDENSAKTDYKDSSSKAYLPGMDIEQHSERLSSPSPVNADKTNDNDDDDLIDYNDMDEEELVRQIARHPTRRELTRRGTINLSFMHSDKSSSSNNNDL